MSFSEGESELYTWSEGFKNLILVRFRGPDYKRLNRNIRIQIDTSMYKGLPDHSPLFF